ncbi:hypothetical protein Tsubulata_009696 [Turnera subulata]|uniref:Auxin-responsive protein n=1 Tax=Turnera subulata TaxID=218843 RepID=A0A9Q0FVV3_9ROSI|nr:hypothetical protein Tsubulata_009696 [Turnera subulata]
MSPEASTDSSSGSEITSMNFKDTELTLGLPGIRAAAARSPEVSAVKTCMKRGFVETVDLSYGRFNTKVPDPDDMSQNRRPSYHAKTPAPKAQLVGWPPVRSFRQKSHESSKLIKVAVDGAPYLRKVDLEMYSSYQELLMALEKMFACFTISRNYTDQESKLMDPVTGTEYVPTYQDKDGDWMLVGDVPWKMFIESCKRIRLKKSTEAVEVGLASESTKCTSKS